MTTKNEEIAAQVASRLSGRTVTSRAHFIEMVKKEVLPVLAAKDAEKEEAVKKERERIKKELGISWDKSIESRSHWDLGDALMVVSVPLTPPTNQ